MKRLVCLAALLLTACSSGVTEVVVTIDAEDQIQAMAGAVHLVVRGGPASGTGYDAPSALDVSVPVGAGASRQFPLHVTVAPSHDDASRRWALDALAVQSGTSNVIATARVRGRFVEGNTLRIGLVLEDACLGITCNADQTCRAGGCVDSTYVPGGDAGVPMDAGVDAGDAATDGGIPAYCPGTDVYVPNPDAGSLRDDGGVPLAFPAPVACPASHAVGAPCGSTATPDDVCFTERRQSGSAFCRTPCDTADPDGGAPILDEARCQALHPDSHCTLVAGFNTDPDDYYCSQPCNPIDDVGCPSGLHCQIFNDTDRLNVITECWVLEANPRHQYEPCGLVGGQTYPVYDGCAAGYLCGFDGVCGVSANGGYVCLQICDADPVSSVLSCPAGSHCVAFGGQGYVDTLGGRHMGLCHLD